MLPHREARLFRDVFKDDGAVFDEATGGNRSIFRVEDRRENPAGRGSCLLLGGGCLNIASVERGLRRLRSLRSDTPRSDYNTDERNEER
jgi:hypothetical protein